MLIIYLFVTDAPLLLLVPDPSYVYGGTKGV